MDLLAPLNRAIMAVHDAGLTTAFYHAWIVVVYIVVAAFCLYWRRHYGYGWFHALLIPLVLLISFYLCVLLMGWVRSGFTFLGSKNVELGYPFVPLMVMGAARLMRDDWRRMLDFMTPGYALMLSVFKVSCCFAGCCFGHPAAHGLWNPIFGETLFPVQLVESAAVLILCVVCCLAAKRRGYRPTGRLYPLFLLLFGTFRFFADFLRLSPTLLWGLSDLALWALAMVAIGAMWLAAKKTHSA
ncbi:MAG: prolipoprotein diacylglyceryl transferase [Oscillospiraceae bacterium]|nr:prolipoprotein diacylglyceryl transferase [Oscillospiraceae bacterium]